MATSPPAVPARLLCWVLCLVSALLLAAIHLRLLARQPEPAPTVPGASEKTPYAELAAGGRVRLTCLLGVAAGSAATVMAGPVAPAWLIWGSGGVVLAGVDAASTWIPRGLTRLVLGELGAALLLGAALAGEPRLVVGALAGAGGVGGFFWVVWRAGAGLGFADVRLAVGLGALTGATGAAGTGPAAAVAAVMATAVIGAATGIIHAMGSTRHGPFPYGPALWLGAYACLAWPPATP
ncbi:MAG: hypothetical protein E7Z97_07905 [Propionibacteriaceae bacterium]|uniref:Leader peptidase (Prepilin peptidase) / N-methyltransferase n=1 Tax=Propionibacterium ruminifibrarum TaxID=1962131 RepID=A0A375I567_9ACTN|nr:hypothetical protein [Propionibacterium ruminifibrarum]MBE6477973.1 hypothetical protein [Propionibacteriaceae bacterium]SPF69268.1 Hypothetical protein PROPJV5_2223 [Propionibacterium ruminifibrarum]